MLLPSFRRNICDWIDCRDSAYTLQARFCSSRSVFGSSSPQHSENLPRPKLYAIVSPRTLRFPLLRDFQEGRHPRTTCFLFLVVNISLSIVFHVLSSYVYSFNYSYVGIENYLAHFFTFIIPASRNHEPKHAIFPANSASKLLRPSVRINLAKEKILST
jgi:hypothetical protein